MARLRIDCVLCLRLHNIVFCYTITSFYGTSIFWSSSIHSINNPLIFAWCCLSNLLLIFESEKVSFCVKTAVWNRFIFLLIYIMMIYLRIKISLVSRYLLGQRFKSLTHLIWSWTKLLIFYNKFVMWSW